MFRILRFWLHLWSILLIEARVREEEIIFDEDYCDVKCGNITHTMCPIENRKPHCGDFELHRFTSPQYQEHLKTLINGHNGIRNRIAERMNVSNMLEMAWDSKLAVMAENYLHFCKDRIPDPCTLSPDIMHEEDTINEFFKFNVSYNSIAQNAFHEQAHFLPYKFLERVIRSWYFEKDGMREPNRVEGQKRLLGENNFTHLAYPFAYRFGCAMAKFKGGFHILCNYYPYYRTLTNSLIVHEGIPVSDCPARFPLRDDSFTCLCTDDASSIFDNVDADGAMKSFNSLIILGVEFMCLNYF